LGERQRSFTTETKAPAMAKPTAVLTTRTGSKPHKIVSAQEWIAARRKFLIAEKKTGWITTTNTWCGSEVICHESLVHGSWYLAV
jgi:hypothetical protein